MLIRLKPLSDLSTDLKRTSVMLFNCFSSVCYSLHSSFRSLFSPALVVDDPAVIQSWLQSSLPQVQTELVCGRKESQYFSILSISGNESPSWDPFPSPTHPLLSVGIVKGVAEEICLHGTASLPLRILQVVLLGNPAAFARGAVYL